MHVMVYWIEEAPRRNFSQSLRETSFSLIGVFSVWSELLLWVLGQVIWRSSIGRARHPGPCTRQLAVEVLGGDTVSSTPRGGGVAAQNSE